LSQSHGAKTISSRRSRLEICVDVLKTIKEGVIKPTQIMYEANLSWKPLKDILDSLQIQGLIVKFDVTHMKDKRSKVGYKLTQKGENVVTYFRDILRTKWYQNMSTQEKINDVNRIEFFYSLIKRQATDQSEEAHCSL